MVLLTFTLQPVAYAKNIIDMDREVLKVELEMLKAQSKAQKEALEIIKEQDKRKRDKKLKKRISRFFKSMRKLKKRISKKSSEEIEYQILKIKRKLTRRGVSSEKLQVFNLMLDSLKRGEFKLNLEKASSVESEQDLKNKLIERLDNEELKVSEISSKNHLRAPAGLISGIIGLWTGGDAAITGIPLFDIIIHIIAIPVVLIAGAVVFGAIGIGMMVYGIFYCMPKWLFTGRGC